MFTFVTQLTDLMYLDTVGLFLVFFTASWSIYFIKILKSNRFVSKSYPPKSFKINVLVPVVDEPAYLWSQVLQSLKVATNGMDARITVIPNGSNAKRESAEALQMGFSVVHVDIPSKRLAIQEGVRYDNDSEITIILDSDTIVKPSSIATLIQAFNDPEVGGATPRHMVFNREGSLIRRISDWMEEIRFNEVVKGQSVDGAVSCLPGRLLAIRTDLLRQALPELVNQTFLGNPCMSGDDRFLTSWLLERGHKAVYVPESEVLTNSPDVLRGFVLQRLRWSRTSFRETLRSLSWIKRYPFTALTVLSTVIFRWFFFIIIINALLEFTGITNRPHFFDLAPMAWFVGTTIGFMLSGFIRQLRHLILYPRDLKYLPAFLFITTFILTPVEWYGNLTLKESSWLTRQVNG